MRMCKVKMVNNLIQTYVYRSKHTYIDILMNLIDFANILEYNN